ncbi:hypothetical protein Tco_0710606 [Tanacetum coccineum]
MKMNRITSLIIRENEEEDEVEEEDEFVKTPSNDSDDEDEVKITDKAEADDETIQKEVTNAELTNIQQGNENPEISQVIEDAHVSHFILYSTIIPQSLPSFNPPPQQSISTPPPTIEATNPQSAIPGFASVFQFNNRVSALEKDVSELKKDDPLKTQVTALVDEHLYAILKATRYEFMSYLSAFITTRITEKVKIQLPQILPKEVSNFAPLEIQRMVTKSLEEAVLAKESSSNHQSIHIEGDKDKDEDPSTGSDRGLKKRKTSKDAEQTKGLKAKESQSGLSKGTQSQSKSSGKSVQSEEPEFETKAAQYDLPGIEDMVPNIWSPVKVAYDKHALWGISHWKDQRRGNRSGAWVSERDCKYTNGIHAKEIWSTLEKKRANIMIKAIDKQLKERRMMRSLEKFVGGRHYGTDLRLLQRTI